MTASRSKVVVVGRDGPARDQFASVLVSAGFEVRCCPAGEDPRALVLEAPKASLIVFYGLNPSGGDELARIRELSDPGETGEVPILLVAPEVRDARVRLWALQAGCADVVSAEVEAPTLVAFALRTIQRAAPARLRPAPRVLLVQAGPQDEGGPLREGLAQCGYQVFEAGSGAEGLRLAALVRPDLLVVDAALSDMSGAAVVQVLRRRPASTRTPYLLLTPPLSPSAELEILSGGIDSYVERGGGAALILSRVARLLRKRSEEAPDLTAPWRLMLLGSSSASSLCDGWCPLTPAEDVIHASSVEDAAQLLVYTRIDGLLLGPDLSVGAAREVCRLIRGVMAGRGLLLLGLVEADDTRTLLELIDAGIDDCLQRGGEVRVDLNRARLESHLRRRAQWDQRGQAVHHQRELILEEARAARELAETRAAILGRSEEARSDAAHPEDGAQEPGSDREEALWEALYRLQRAMRGTSDGLWEWDLRSGELWCSPRYRELLGWEQVEDTVPVERFFTGMHPDDRERVEEAVRAHLGGERPYDVELRLRHGDGEFRWFRVRGSATRGADGVPQLVSGSIHDRTDQKWAEEALRASEDKYRRLAQNLSGKFFLYTRDSTGAFTAVSASAEDMLGYAPHEPLPPLAELLTDAEVNERVRSFGDQVLAGLQHPRYEVEVRHRSGGARRLVISEVPVFDPEGGVVGVEGIAQDVTEERALAAQLQHTQRLEAVGRLAGGIAHDSNNMLSVMLGYSDMTLDCLEPDHRVRPYVERIRSACNKSAELTRKLLSFSRKQVLRPRLVQLDLLLRDLEPLVQQLVGESIELRIVCPTPVPAIHVDPGQLEQVLINLSANASDAMPRGGKLTIEVSRRQVGDDFAAFNPDTRVGDYVMLAVTDAGSGMDRETLSHVFEPFFTTKPPGKGTGLGLASAHGFVRQSGGFILVYSELGHGTTFKLHFPASEASSPEPQRDEPRPGPVRGGTERILLVEDEPLVRSMVLEVLRSSGFRVTAPETPEEALMLCERSDEEFELIITDVVMPGLSGPSLVARARRVRPAVKVIFMSGYAETAIALHGLVEPGAHFVGKPIAPAALTRKVRAVLDAPDPISLGSSAR